MRDLGGLRVVSPLLLACSLAGGGCSTEPVPPAVVDVGIEEAWIPMPDGVRLAADLHLPPEVAAGERFPVLLEYLPYRKAESRGDRYPLYSYFVRHGYVVARVDIRGTGNSEGRLVDYEYTDREQEDGESVIAWLAAQPFSTGRIGMFGISWGGFNSIHMAMRNPPALGAVIALMATDDLYEDDVHFIDGVLHFDSYEIGQDVENALPGAPDFVLDEQFFRDRFDTTPWLQVYKRQQRDGPFWNRASLNEDYSRIRTPTFVIGGWYDGYRDSVPRMLQHLEAPVKAMVGPWGHAWPNEAYPEPSMEWRHEAVRWFDHFLKDRDTGILDEPAFAVYVRDWHPPGLTLDRAPGHWRFEDGWPLQRGEQLVLFAHDDKALRASPAAPAIQELDYLPSAGIEAGGSVMWWGDFMPDQQPTDDKSFYFDSDPLAEDVEILGFPHALLRVDASAPLAHWFVRLSDVAPDGRVTQITGAALNGGHRDSASEPRPLVPGEPVDLEIEMHFTSWVFPPGHRIRLSVSNAQWPMFWPTPYPMSTRLHLGADRATRLVLPVVPAAPRPQPDFLPPAENPVLPGYRPLEVGTISWYAELSEIERDPTSGQARVTLENTRANEYPWGIVETVEKIVHGTNDRHPADSSVLGDYQITVRQPHRTLRVQGLLDLRSDRDDLYFLYTRRLWENDSLLRERQWTETIPRDSQ